MPNFSSLKGVILTIPGWGGRILRNKTKLQPNLVEFELWLSLAIVDIKGEYSDIFVVVFSAELIETLYNVYGFMEEYRKLREN